MTAHLVIELRGFASEQEAKHAQKLVRDGELPLEQLVQSTPPDMVHTYVEVDT